MLEKHWTMVIQQVYLWRLMPPVCVAASMMCVMRFMHLTPFHRLVLRMHFTRTVRHKLRLPSRPTSYEGASPPKQLVCCVS